MKLKFIASIVSACLVAACSDSPQKSQSAQIEAMPKKDVVAAKAVDQNQAFEQFKTEFLEAFWKINPGHAVYVGYYEFDDVLPVYNDEHLADQKAFIDKFSGLLQKFDPKNLSALNATDLELIKNQIESDKWYRDEFKIMQWNPSLYNVAGVFGVILNTDYKSLDERLRTISKRMDSIPAFYQAAVSNITIPTLEHTELAIQQNKGALGVFKKSIPDSLAKSTLSEVEKKSFQPKLASSIKAIESYVEWLERKRETIKDGKAKDFRIGEALYEQKFKHDIVSDFTGKELYQRAIRSKNDLHANMIEITKQLWPKYLKDTEMPKEPLVAVKQLIDHLSAKHVKREDFVKEVQRQMPIIEQFIIEKDLLDMDPTRPLIIRETPEYQRGFSVASVNAPGPYDATANTYYNVSPLDDYTEAQAESHLREYNHWILQVLNIHEAMPGHYTQLLHSNKSPSLIKSIFGNGAMVEGWAVYSEKMMLEAGYSGDDSDGPSPEMWLMYSKWNLRVVVNTILDYSIQVLGMEREAGLDLLMNQAFQERTEAEGKWRRATLSQVQLTSYFNGFSEIYAFREEMKQKMGEKFNLKDFHNQFLSYGSAPVPVIRKLMLAELSK